MSSSRADPYLQVEGEDSRIPLVNGQSWAIGRSDTCGVVLDSRSVSRLHALIQRMERGGYCLIDLGSRNGSFVNGRRVSIPVALQDKDRLAFGDQRLRFRCDEAVTPPSDPEDFSQPDAPTSSLMTYSTTTILVVDIRDFTPLARVVSEELLSQAIGTWFLRVGEVAQKLGSWAQKYIGDAVMAVWMHDVAKPGRAEMLPVLEAVSRIKTVTDEVSRMLPLPAPLRIGVGVNTGPAIVGPADYTALGETVNVAFRLEAATKTIGYNIALGRATFDALQLTGAHRERFTRREVVLKGYECESTAWAISFEHLQDFLAAVRQDPH